MRRTKLLLVAVGMTLSSACGGGGGSSKPSVDAAALQKWCTAFSDTRTKAAALFGSPPTNPVLAKADADALRLSIDAMVASSPADIAKDVGLSATTTKKLLDVYAAGHYSGAVLIDPTSALTRDEISTQNSAGARLQSYATANCK
jgi:hypothetical protein